MDYDSYRLWITIPLWITIHTADFLKKDLLFIVQMAFNSTGVSNQKGKEFKTQHPALNSPSPL